MDRGAFVTSDRYTHGHHESVLRSHTWRTAQNSAAFLLADLAAGADVLDVGCGPGTISADLARLVTPGNVHAIDVAEEVIERARHLHENDALSNLVFSVENVYDLSFDNERFDVVYAHQVLQHLSDPVAALMEMRRVLREEGILAVRDADYGAFVWWPLDPRLDEWMDLYHRVTTANYAEANAGRFLAAWVRAAGFRDLRVTSSNWTFHDEPERQWWGNLWADRVRHSDFATQAIDHGFATSATLERISLAFLEWSKQQDGVFIVVNGEVLAYK